MAQTTKKVGDYKLGKKIGSGATSDVFQGRKENQLQRYAIKMIKIKSMSPEQRSMIAKQHPHIVKLYETLQTANHYYLIFQYCERGDLQKYLKQNVEDLLSFNKIKTIINCIAQAIHHLHSKGIAHRDIKLANVLVKKDYTIKLADFGFAKQENGEDMFMKTYCGTPITMAPQILKGKPYDKKCDIWSLGVILFQLTFGKLPFPIDQGYSVFIDKVTNEKVKIPSKPAVPQSLKQLIYGCLQINQTKRYNIEQFLQSKFMNNDHSNFGQTQQTVQTVSEILKSVAIIKSSKTLDVQSSQEGVQKSNSSLFQNLLAKRLLQIISEQVNNIFARHKDIRQKIMAQINQNHELYNSVLYYDWQIIEGIKNKKIKIRGQGMNPVFVQINKINKINILNTLSEYKKDAPLIGTVINNYLKTIVSDSEFQLDKKISKYQLITLFLDMVHNFDLQITLLFNNGYQIDYSLQNVSKLVQQQNQETYNFQYHRGLNHLSITLQCRQKDEKIRQLATTLKKNCLKRIDDIQRQINGY